ncbi:MAG: hypothetical protein ABI886_16955 [Betaproteobacteria bacterium]
MPDLNDLFHFAQIVEHGGLASAILAALSPPEVSSIRMPPLLPASAPVASVDNRKRPADHLGRMWELFPRLLPHAVAAFDVPLRPPARRLASSVFRNQPGAGLRRRQAATADGEA